MKILLKTDIKKLGRKGDIVEVADGYASSALIPTGKAEVASPGMVAQAKKTEKAKEVGAKKQEEAAHASARELKGKVINYSAKADGGKLFGSVGQAEVAAELKSQYNIAVAEKAILLEHPIKEVGEVSVEIDFGYGAKTEMVVSVTAL